MLILTRRVGEVLIINNNIKVTVLGVRGHQVRIGIDAPRDVEVHREEIFNRIQDEQAGVASGSKGDVADIDGPEPGNEAD